MAKAARETRTNPRTDFFISDNKRGYAAKFALSGKEKAK
jgi:hypothetical protein